MSSPSSNMNMTIRNKTVRIIEENQLSIGIKAIPMNIIINILGNLVYSPLLAEYKTVANLNSKVIIIPKITGHQYNQNSLIASSFL